MSSKRYLKFSFTFTFTFTLILIMLIINSNSVKAVSLSDEGSVAKYLSERYGGTFGDDKRLYTNVKNYGKVSVNSNYLVRGRLFYGNSNTSNSIFQGNLPGYNNQYYSSLGVNRFIGVTDRGYFPYGSSVITPDYPTSGETSKDIKKYRKWRTDTVNNYTIRPNSDLPWNVPSRIRDTINLNGQGFPSRSLSDDDAILLYEKWLKHLSDHYGGSLYDEYKRVLGSTFTRSSKGNEWQKMSHAERANYAHIIIPPSELTWGRVFEWHRTGIAHGNGEKKDLYDIYDIKPITDNEMDFEAVKLNLLPSGNALSMSFTVRSNSENDVELELPPLDSYYIYVNGVLDETHKNVATFGTDWKKGQNITQPIGSKPLGAYKAGDVIEVYARVNFDEKAYDKKSKKYEKDFSNNEAYAKYVVKGAEICRFGGSGSSDFYEILTCTKTATGTGTRSDGSSYTYTYCAKYECLPHNISLKHNVELLFNEKRQGLLGMWSANSNGHAKYKNSVRDANELDVVNEKWDIKINSHSVPGVNKLKRVIRAGRALQMYGTIEVDMRIESFKPNTVDGSQKAFVQSLIKDLKTMGVELDSGNKAGAVTDNTGEKSVDAQVDKDRTKVDGMYIKFKKDPSEAKVTYGTSTCKQVDVYSKSYNFEIAVKTKNSTGKQDTKSGDFQPRLSYQVNSGISEFFTNINTRNGIHGIKFRTLLNGRKIDPGFNATKQCYSLEEAFGVQGNIYDDVRSDEVTDKVKEDNWDW